MWLEVLCALVAFLAIYLTRWIYKWGHPKCDGILPPGSMGFPFIGETLHLFSTSYSLDLHPFIKNRIQRYGPIFKTSLGGRPVVVSADPHFSHHIFLQEGRSVEMWYLDTFSKLFGQDGDSRTNAVGAVHKYVRSITLSHFGSEILKTRAILQLEEFLKKTLHSWSACSSVEVKHASAAVILDFTAKLLFSYDSETSPEKIGDNFADFLQGLMSFPLNIPGTAFHRCFQSQKKLKLMIKNILEQKLESPVSGPGDLLDQALKDLKTEKFLSEDFIVNVMFGILFASSESISAALTLALRFLLDHPAALEELRAEHHAILRNRENSDQSSLTWDEYKSMTFTLQVINETLRMGSVAPGLLRRSTKDIQANGFTIPKDWTIMVVIPALQLNPEAFKDPLVFNPWRWKDLDSTVVAKNFMPFGGGIRQCAGADFSRLFIATFLHILVTKYRWTKIKVGKLRRSPMLGFGDGVHINLSPIQN